MAERNNILMPKLGLTMTEGTLAEWQVAVGDAVQAGDVLFVVETDKVATEVTAPSAGKVLDIVVAQGQVAPVGAVVAHWTGTGQPATDAAAGDGPPADLPPADAPATNVPAARVQADAPPPLGSSAGAAAGGDGHPAGGRVVATPLARRLAQAAGIDLRAVAGSGPHGRIKAQDVRAAQALGENAPVVAAPDVAVAGRPQVTSSIAQAMARRMVPAKRDVPHFYLSTEAEVSELLALRARLNRNDASPRLTLNHFLLAALAHALARCPWQNRIWLDDGIVAFDTLDIGMAVATDQGLWAPVLHDLGGASLDTIATRADALAQRVRQGQVRQADMEGGAITLSNAGMFNVTHMAPIINPPQSAILGVGSVREVFRPDSQGQPALHREIGLVLACDHRLHDGHSGLRFLNTVVELLEDPYPLLRSLP